MAISPTDALKGVAGVMEYGRDEPTEDPARHTAELRKARRWRGPWLPLIVALAGAAVAAAVVLGVLALVGGSSKETLAKGSEAGGFRIEFPDGWKSVPPQSVSRNPAVVGALRTKSGRGLILIRREGPALELGQQFVRDIDRELRKQLPDYRAIGVKAIQVRAGKALHYSYARTKAGEIHTITVVPAGDHSFVIDTVSPLGDVALAEEIGAILRTFSLT